MSKVIWEREAPKLVLEYQNEITGDWLLVDKFSTKEEAIATANDFYSGSNVRIVDTSMD